MSKLESQRADGQNLMARAVGDARVEPKGTLSRHEASLGFGKIDPLMAVFNATALMATHP